MRPLVFVNGVIFGSATALGGVLGVVLFLRFVLRLDNSLDQSVVRSGLPLWKLLRYTLSFSVLAVLAGGAFWAQLVAKPWRWFAEYALLVAISAVLVSIFSDTGRRGHDLVFLGLVALGVLVLWLVTANSWLFRRVGIWLSRD